MAEIYHEGNPVTSTSVPVAGMRPVKGLCESLTLDIFRDLPGLGISRYGERRWLRLDITSVTSDPGMLVFDLPLNTPEPNGLGFAVDFFDAQMLAFEIAPYVLDACYTVIGAEVFESSNIADTAISNVAVFKSAADLQAYCGTCNIYSPVNGQCDDGNADTIDVCNERPDSDWGQCLNIVEPAWRTNSRRRMVIDSREPLE